MIRLAALTILSSVATAQYNNHQFADALARGVQGTAEAITTDNAQYFTDRLDIAADAIKSAASDIASIEDVFNASDDNDVNVKPAYSLAHVIHVGESKRRGYNDYNRGSGNCRASNAGRLSITTMTFGQIAAAQSLPACSKNKLLAVGMYQDIDVTRAMRALNISADTVYSESMQDKVFAYYLTQRKQPAIASYIRSGKGLREAGHAVAAEWASIQSVKTGRGLYDGKGTNKAHIKALRVVEALQRARIVYSDMLQAGYSDKQAFAKAVGV